MRNLPLHQLDQPGGGQADELARGLAVAAAEEDVGQADAGKGNQQSRPPSPPFGQARNLQLPRRAPAPATRSSRFAVRARTARAAGHEPGQQSAQRQHHQRPHHGDGRFVEVLRRRQVGPAFAGEDQEVEP